MYKINFPLHTQAKAEFTFGLNCVSLFKIFYEIAVTGIQMQPLNPKTLFFKQICSAKSKIHDISFRSYFFNSSLAMVYFFSKLLILSSFYLSTNLNRRYHVYLLCYNIYTYTTMFTSYSTLTHGDQ